MIRAVEYVFESMSAFSESQNSFSAAQKSAGGSPATGDRPAALGLGHRAWREVTSAGFWWTVLAVAAWVATSIIPKWHPEWFVSSSGQISVASGWVGAFVGVGLIAGSRWARWIALAFLAASVVASTPLLDRLVDGSPNFVNRHATGYALLIGLDVVAFSILAFVPAVRHRFYPDGSSPS